MRKLLLAVSFLSFIAVGLSGCHTVTVGPASRTTGIERARPLDNFGEILKPKAAADLPRGAGTITKVGKTF